MRRPASSPRALPPPLPRRAVSRAAVSQRGLAEGAAGRDARGAVIGRGGCQAPRGDGCGCPLKREGRNAPRFPSASGAAPATALPAARGGVAWFSVFPSPRKGLGAAPSRSELAGGETPPKSRYSTAKAFTCPRDPPSLPAGRSPRSLRTTSPEPLPSPGLPSPHAGAAPPAPWLGPHPRRLPSLSKRE